jgi:ribosome-associated protein
MREVAISSEPVELYKLLKFESLVSSGGEAKHVIAEGLVLVNGQVETRKRKKIVSGDIVEFGKEKIHIQLQKPRVPGLGC